MGKKCISLHANGSERRPPTSAALDLQAGGHQLEVCTVQGRRSLVCRKCNMRSTINNRIWFQQHACGEWVTRRRDSVPCPMGMRDLVCSTTGGSYCVCLWCGAADKQRANIIRRHACWRGPLRQAVAASGRSVADHIEFLSGRVGDHAHTLDAFQGKAICLRCGTLGRALRFKRQCGAFQPAQFGLSLDEYKRALRASVECFEPLP